MKFSIKRTGLVIFQDTIRVFYVAADNTIRLISISRVNVHIPRASGAFMILHKGNDIKP
jgi:hypothetical protein